MFTIIRETKEKSAFKNARYRDNLRHLKTIVNDQPHTSLERAVWWTEYVLRHRGAAHLRTAAVDMPWYQYLLLDVAAFLLATILVAIILLWRITKFLFRKLLPSTTQKAKKK
ncbi:hypothetical protein PR048_004349 [Dryococelus australis]|uniref:UDP-glucuronosyltransferase n=1 Tax=Dryococelus australis TaxID=614101 RepID=A0ABQ9I569_9NEOP|nr:hypothetical protein PR048_004349 [Dryococelus australis]